MTNLGSCYCYGQEPQGHHHDNNTMFDKAYALPCSVSYAYSAAANWTGELFRFRVYSSSHLPYLGRTEAGKSGGLCSEGLNPVQVCVEANVVGLQGQLFDFSLPLGGCSSLAIDRLVSLMHLRAFVLASLILAHAHHGRFDAIAKLLQIKSCVLEHIWDPSTRTSFIFLMMLDKRLLRPTVSPFATILEWYLTNMEGSNYCREGILLFIVQLLTLSWQTCVTDM